MHGLTEEGERKGGFGQYGEDLLPCCLNVCYKVLYVCTTPFLFFTMNQILSVIIVCRRAMFGRLYEFSHQRTKNLRCEH